MIAEIKQNTRVLSYTGRISPSNRDFYGTPPEWVERAREVMGGIELDPASCEEANTRIVMADRFYTKENDALTKSWRCKSLFLNPPYSGRLKREFSAKFFEEWSSGNIGQAVILVNNCTETVAFEMLSSCSAARAETRFRISFVSVSRRSQTGNTRGQVFFYCGKRARIFAKVFSAANCRVVSVLK